MTAPPEEFAEHLATSIQTPPEVKGWFDASKEYGLALILLALVFLVLWRLARWVRPMAEDVLRGMVANNARVPEMLSVQSVQNSAVLTALTAQNILLQQIAERLSNNIDRTQLVATHVSTLSGHVLNLTEKISEQ